MLNLLFTLLVVVLLYKSLIFLMSLVTKRNDIADISWGTSFVLIAVTVLIYTKNFSPVYIVALALVLIWGTRLAVRILLRNLKRKEDFRYAALKEKTQGNLFYIRSFFQVYILQCILAIVVSLPVILIGYYGSSNLSATSYVGIGIWIVGFIFESVGDYELDQFKKDSKNKGKILMTGLWKYSRHPNYFGEITMWWGIFVISLTSAPFYISIIGPIAITFLITKVSGIPMLEKHYAGNPEFEEYKKHTSVLIPWIVKE